MVRNSDTTIAKNLLQAGASIDHINFRSLRPQFKELIEVSSIQTYPCVPLFLGVCVCRKSVLAYSDNFDTHVMLLTQAAVCYCL